MLELKNIETAVLLTMLAAHSASYRRFLTKKQTVLYKRTIKRLQSEIEHRQHDHIDIAITRAAINPAQII